MLDVGRWVSHKMKFSRFAIFLFLIFGSGDIKALPLGYYFIESGCKNCQPFPGDKRGDHWLITDTVYAFWTEDIEREIALVLNDYKAGLIAKFPNYANLISQARLSYQQTRGEAEWERRQKIKKMEGQGYQVWQSAFHFYSRNAVPEVDAYLSFAGKLGFDGVALIAEDDWVIHHRAYGRAGEGGPLIHSPQTIFPIGSIAKSFTAQAILLLKESGKLKLSTKLGKLWRRIPENKRLISIEQLLTHTAGFPRDVLDKNDLSREEVRKALWSSDVLFRPGEGYHYSNAAYQLLALIVEKVGKQPYDDFIQEHIIDVFQLKNTGFYHRPPNRRMISEGRIPGEKRSFKTISQKRYTYLGADGLFSTAGDLFQWYRNLSKMPFFKDMAQAHFGKESGYGFSVKGLMLEAGSDTLNYQIQLSHDRLKNRLFILFSRNDWSKVPGDIISRRLSEIMDVKITTLVPESLSDAKVFTGRYTNGQDTLDVKVEHERIKVYASGPRLIQKLKTTGLLPSHPEVEEKTPKHYKSFALSTAEQELTCFDLVTEQAVKLLFSEDYRRVRIDKLELEK